MKFDISKPATTSDSNTTYEPLASGLYRARITGARIAPSKFADEKTGEYRAELTLVWDLAEKVTHPETPNKEYSDRFYQHMSPFVGLTNAGTPSKLLALLQQLASENLIDPQDVDIAEADNADNQGSLIGIERRLLIQRYQKTMGPNAGQWGNKIVDVLPLDGPAPITEKPIASRPAPKPVPSDGTYTEAEIRAMSADELLPIVKNMAEEAGGRFKKRPYDTMTHTGLVKQALEIQAELDPTAELF